MPSAAHLLAILLVGGPAGQWHHCSIARSGQPSAAGVAAAHLLIASEWRVACCGALANVCCGVTTGVCRGARAHNMGRTSIVGRRVGAARLTIASPLSALISLIYDYGEAP